MSSLTTLADSLLAAFASPFTQQNRLVRLRFSSDSGIASDTLLAHRVTGHEAISEPFCFTVEAFSADSLIELKALHGQGVALTVQTAHGEERALTGIVSLVTNGGSNGGAARYLLRIEPALVALKHRRNSRTFQDKNVLEIVQSILNEHIDRNPVFSAHFALDIQTRKRYPTRSYCQQYRESDYAFITRLLAEEGISYTWTYRDEDTPVHVMSLFDDVYTLDAAMQPVYRFHRADGTESDDSITHWESERRIGPGSVALNSFDYKRVATYDGIAQSAIDQGERGNGLASTLESYDHQAPYYGADDDELARYALLRQQAADLPMKTFAGSGTVRSMGAGHYFELRDHPEHDHDSPQDREFVILSLDWRAQNNLPGDAGKQLQTLFPFGQRLAGETAADAAYRCAFKAVRRGIPIVPAYSHTEHAKPTAPALQTAIVVGPPGQEIHTDEYGRIPVQFPWQRRQDHPDGGADFDDKSSTWVRVATPSANAQWGISHLPRVGSEVLIGYLENDIDRPVILSALHNGTHLPPSFSNASALPADKALSGTKTKEIDGQRFNELVFDDTTGEIRTKLSSEHGKTQLNQGYLIHPRRQGKGDPRGEGYELTTDEVGALRAAKGLFLSAWARMQASGKQLSREEFTELQDDCYRLFVSLGQEAAKHQAMEVDPKPQEKLKDDFKNWENGSNTAPGKDGGGAPVIGITSPAGISYATPQNIVSYAGKHHDGVAQENMQLVAGQRFNLNAGTGISLFSHKEGFKAIAHYGKMLIQAQHDDVVVNASENVTMTASHGKVVIMAAKEILLATADGAYLKLAGSNAEMGGPGTLAQKFSDHHWDGPASAATDLPSFKQGELERTPQLLRPTDGAPVEGAAFQILTGDGSMQEGKTGADGKAPTILADRLKTLAMRFLAPKE